MGEIGETRSILGTRIRQWMAGTAVRICAKFTWKTRLVLRSDELECQGQKSKIKVTTDKNALSTNTPAVWTKWNGLVADNVSQAGASISSLARGVFAGLRSECGVRWAWRATAGLCHAFLVVLDLVSSLLSQEIGWEERLRNDLFCFEWDVKVEP